MTKTIRLKKQKHQPTYKFKINDQIDLLPRSSKIKSIIKYLQGFGISRSDFYRDRNLPFASKKSISDDRMVIYSQLFDCTVDELRNSTITVKPLIATQAKKFNSPLK